MKINYNNFIEFIRGLKGQTIYTMSKEKPFTVDVTSYGLYEAFTVIS